MNEEKDEIKLVINKQYGSQAIIGVDLAAGPDITAYPGHEYISRFAESNHMSIEQAKEQAICKEFLKHYEEENNE